MSVPSQRSRAGDDTLPCGDGPDLLCGNGDTDILLGGDYHEDLPDFLAGGRGADPLDGQRGPDEIRAGGATTDSTAAWATIS